MPIGDDDRIVVLSDLHLGDGGRGDDFASNAPLVMAALDLHYRKEHFRVVLNGDIEELMRFPLPRIRERWRDFFELLDRFPPGRVVKLVGNHDLALRFRRDDAERFPVCEAVRFRYRSDEIFIFHGHQASLVTQGAHRLNNAVLRWLARPLGIPNYSVAHDSRRKYRVEERVYRFARNRRIMAVIGHTHRPLFESLSKADRLRFRIEQLCRAFPSLSPSDQEQTAAEIRRSRNELCLREPAAKAGGGALYHQGPLVPCLFNSGCAIGKSGITAIEIRDGAVSLVQWFDRRRSARHAGNGEFVPERLAGTEIFRVVIQSEPLRYLFARIKLLADEPAATPDDRHFPAPRLNPEAAMGHG